MNNEETMEIMSIQGRVCVEYSSETKGSTITAIPKAPHSGSKLFEPNND